ncbi:hemin receptor [Vibrio sp. 10N.286.49.B3]|uniref:heme/hemin ABC transporter substrate-binding protein n=1 Tax=Vibrio sp. 10N.286.49.B3 TaxID=1880855 RepID=UPI000C82E139|nr:ABC transporter substrate-binding protein [Vibrio sp. 10N.286.49.B3]PMH37100.1 hemin receptor [Vibrio sp. 10N.286.49.B3]
MNLLTTQCNRHVANLSLLTSLFIATFSFAGVNNSEDNQPLRIISVGSSVTEIFYALGVEDQLVAVDVTSRHFVQESGLPQVGYHRQLSAEGLMALNPSHLIGSNEMGPNNTLDLLKASQVNIINVSSGDNMDDLDQRIDRIASLTGAQDKAEAIKLQVQKELQQLANDAPKNHPSMLFLMLNKERPATVAGSETSIDKIITLAGGTNPAAQSMRSFKPISYEAIITMQPDYLLVSQRVWDQFGSAEAIIAAFPLLAATPAGQTATIVPVPSSAIIGGFGLESLQLSQSLNQQIRLHALD